MATVATLRDLISALIETSVQAFKLSAVTSDMEKFFFLLHSIKIKERGCLEIYLIN